MSAGGSRRKSEVPSVVDAYLPALVELSSYLHDNPETAFNEHKACDRLSSMMEAEGFSVERGTGDLDTAFKATFTRGRTGPAIAMLAEYDALPEIGHGCGHNLIAAMSAGAAIAAKRILEESDLEGSILLVGTPAEERGGGKGLLLSRGCFSGIDCAMMVHPSTHTRVEDSSLASTRLIARYSGKPAHAAASPWSGANALEATIQTFNLINAWRCQLREPSRINGIIVQGGTAVNIIPDFAEAQFGIRAMDRGYLDELVDKVRACANSAAAALGVSVEVERVGKGYDAIRNNPVLAGLMAENFGLVGESVVAMPRGAGLGSTDMGNVTQCLPGLHCYVKVDEGIEPHTAAFAAACGSPSASRAIAAGAKAMGMTAVELMEDPGLAEEARRAFESGQA